MFARLVTAKRPLSQQHEDPDPTQSGPSDRAKIKALDFSVSERARTVAHDVTALRANAELPDGLIVSGLVYDVATGRIETVVAAAPLRAAA